MDKVHDAALKRRGETSIKMFYPNLYKSKSYYMDFEQKKKNLNVVLTHTISLKKYIFFLYKGLNNLI